MGQKVNPHGLRVGIIKDWDSRWYAEKDFATNLAEDFKIREYIKKRYYKAGISNIEIERITDKIKVKINVNRKGDILGEKGVESVALQKKISKMVKPGNKVFIEVYEVYKKERNAQLVAEDIADQLERRISFRRAMKVCMQRTMKAGAKGIKTAVSGRLGGVDMARTEFYSEGTIPLQTLRADISYGFAEADTTYGKIGVKVWIYQDEVLPGKKPYLNRKENTNNNKKDKFKKDNRKFNNKPKANKNERGDK